jgi:hypothetical protein
VTVGPEPGEAAAAAVELLLPLLPLLPQPATTRAMTPIDAAAAMYLRVISDPP